MLNKGRVIKGSVGIVLMLMLGAMYAWSYFKVALGQAYPDWSQTKITLNFTLMMSCFCIGGFVAGKLLRTLNKRTQIWIAAVLIGAGFFGSSMLSSDPMAAMVQLYLCYGVMTGLGTGIAYNAVISGIQPWFPDCPGLISGVLLMGMGFGSLILGNVAAKLVEQVGLQMTFRLFAIMMLVILLLLGAIVRVPGKEDTLPKTEKKKALEGATDYTVSQMLHRPTFWLYFGWNILVSAGGMLVINSASSITLFYGLAAVVGLFVSVFNGCGRLGIGFLMDKLGWKKTMFLNNGIMLLSGIVLCVGDKSNIGIVVLIGMLLMGICYGGGITISAALIRGFYGEKHYAANFSVVNLCLIPASIIGPIISAALYDMAGNYWTTFVMVVVLGIATLALNIMIRKP